MRLAFLRRFASQEHVALRLYADSGRLGLASGSRIVAAPFFLFFVAVELLALVTNDVLFVSCFFVDGAIAT